MSTTSLTRKKKIENGHRLFTKRLISVAASNLDALKDNPSNTEARNKWKLSKVSLTGRLNTLDKLDAEILSKIEEDQQIEAEIFDAGKFKEVLENILLDIHGALQPQVSNVSENPSMDTDTGEAEIQKMKG